MSSSSQIENHSENSVYHKLLAIDSMISNLSIQAISEPEQETSACNDNYEAKFVDDVTVHFADTVRILRDNNDDWLYVQVVENGRTGFVPRTIVIDLNQFIDQLKIHKQQLIRNKSNFVKFPVRV